MVLDCCNFTHQQLAREWSDPIGRGTRGNVATAGRILPAVFQFSPNPINTLTVGKQQTTRANKQSNKMYQTMGKNFTTFYPAEGKFDHSIIKSNQTENKSYGKEGLRARGQLIRVFASRSLHSRVVCCLLRIGFCFTICISRIDIL